MISICFVTNVIEVTTANTNFGSFKSYSNKTNIQNDLNHFKLDLKRWNVIWKMALKKNSQSQVGTVYRN